MPVPQLRSSPRPRRGMPLLLVFLLATLGLSLWLGFQAVEAARSHRRTAEGILRDYAQIAVSEYSRRSEESMERFFRELFDEVPWRVRRDLPPLAMALGDELEPALRRVGCRCETLRREAVFLLLDLQRGEIRSIPETVPDPERRRVAEAVRTHWSRNPEERIALLTAPAGAIADEAVAVAFNASLDETGEEGRGRAIYMMMAPADAWGELFGCWYREGPLLPEVVAGPQSNDSLLHLAVYTPAGDPLFLSPRQDPGALMTRDTLDAEHGGLVVEAAVRPEAASVLVIGGLPQARLPFLLALMVMTMGVGVAALIQIRKEEELARLRDDFISGVSHEFRTPLTQIRMFTELMADGKLRTQEEWDRSTTVINREARRLTHLVENILFFSRMGRAPAHQGPREAVEVAGTFEELVEAFGPVARARGAELVTRVDPPQAVVLASRGGLHQILGNLLDNALKYGPAGQTIRLEAVAGPESVRIAVEDQGPGIPPRERGRVWEPYRRLQREVDGNETGSGIGLSVVQRLVASFDGRVRVEEGEGGGALFVVELPGEGGG